MTSHALLEAESVAEVEPLLEASISDLGAFPKPRVDKSVLWRVAPIVLVASLGTSITTTTQFDIIRSVSCKVWYLVNAPDKIPSNGRLPDEMCRLGEHHSPEAYFAMFMTFVALFNGIGHFITSSVVARFSNSWGRRPVFILLCLVDIVAVSFLTTSIISNSHLAIYALVLAVVIAVFSDPFMMYLVASMMVVDSTDPTERTAALSRLQGALWLGLAPGYALGGWVAVTFGPTTTLLAASALSVIKLTYSAITLRETLTAPEMNVVQREQMQMMEQQVRKPFLQRTRRAILAVFAPLKYVVPHRDPHTGRRNPRLLLFALGGALYTLAMSYFPPVMVIYASNELYFNAGDTGWLLTVYQTTKVIFLLFVLPPTLLAGRRFYLPAHERTSRSSVSAREAEKVSNHFDVHLIIASWIWEGIIALTLPLAASKGSYIALVAGVTLGIGWTAAFDSAVVASVDRLDTSGVLSAMQMIKSVAEVGSGLIVGNLATWSVGVMPTLPFFVLAAFSFSAAFIVLFVRDSDRRVDGDRDMAE
ncbi:MFS general substrate transporter [Clavulina sp. PMI_390]|nr:MFS general substrate transporter [Clavulina sp. PMI_390]